MKVTMSGINLFRSQDEYDDAVESIEAAVKEFDSVEDFEQYLDDTYDEEEYDSMTPRQKEIRRYCIHTIIDRIKSKPIGYLMVTRDDEEYDTKSGFKSFTEANKYRCEAQRSWMGHCDYVYHIYHDENEVRHCVNLTKLSDDELKEHLSKFNIKY